MKQAIRSEAQAGAIASVENRAADEPLAAIVDDRESHGKGRTSGGIIDTDRILLSLGIERGEEI
ncbi:MAG: hypothetical protein R3246_13250, partial [Acidimicrobiia bacterium]|nr:hypothetical protein [Acidimicrobiia bacterium]